MCIMEVIMDVLAGLQIYPSGCLESGGVLGFE